MTHIAIQEDLDDKNVEWMEKVNEEQYHRCPVARRAVRELADLSQLSA